MQQCCWPDLFTRVRACFKVEGTSDINVQVILIIGPYARSQIRSRASGCVVYVFGVGA